MASNDQDDHMPEETQGYKLSQPKQSLAEYQNMGEKQFLFRLLKHLCFFFPYFLCPHRPCFPPLAPKLSRGGR